MTKRKKRFDGQPDDMGEPMGEVGEALEDWDGKPQEDPPAPESAADPPKPTPESPAIPPLPKIPFKVFEKVAGPRWDQLAGFRSYAKAQDLGPMTIPEWREALQAFQNKPTRR